MSKYTYLTCVVTSTIAELDTMGFEQRRVIIKRTFLKHVQPNRDNWLKVIQEADMFIKGVHHGRPCYCRVERGMKIIYTYIYKQKGGV